MSTPSSIFTPPYFYPRPPRGGRQKHSPEDYVMSGISIHALREEGDGSI